MVLHIGCDEFVPLSSVVAVLDAALTPALLEQVPKEDFPDVSIRRIGQDDVKSVVITNRGGRCAFFLSPISAQTLRKRVESGL